jgi:hypothetical protein
MAKSGILVLGAALAASSVQALAHEREIISSGGSPALPVATGLTGLTAKDLFVDRDGMVAIDVKAPGMMLAGPSDTRCPANNSGTC